MPRKPVGFAVPVYGLSCYDDWQPAAILAYERVLIACLATMQETGNIIQDSRTVLGSYPVDGVDAPVEVVLRYAHNRECAAVHIREVALQVHLEDYLRERVGQLFVPLVALPDHILRPRLLRDILECVEVADTGAVLIADGRCETPDSPAVHEAELVDRRRRGADVRLSARAQGGKLAIDLSHDLRADVLVVERADLHFYGQVPEAPDVAEAVVKIDDFIRPGVHHVESQR